MLAFRQYQAIRNGKALLDKKVPGWAEKIDLDTLSMSSVNACVLGQVFGTFQDGMEALELYSCEDDERHGFFSFAYHEYDSLNERWKTVIRREVSKHVG